MQLMDLTTGNASFIEVRPYDFAPGSHTLTITFMDEEGNMGSSQYLFEGLMRDGKQLICFIYHGHISRYLSAGLVTCHSEYECGGAVSMMTERECCVENPEGRSLTTSSGQCFNCRGKPIQAHL